MNGRVNVKKRQRFPWVPMIAALAAMFGCQERVIQGEGGSMDETSTLAFHRKDGSPAVGARVQLYGSADTGVEPRVQLIANAQGGVDVPVPAKGYYNLVVRGRDGDALFQDSLYSNGVVLQMQGDTLRRTGALTGRIRVQPQHSPRIAWIHVLGAGIWSNVDDSGRFKLEGVPAGRYTLAAYTLVDGYTPTFAGIKTISDSTVDAGDIQMVFTGLPVVRNLEARFDTLAGLVSLRWDSIALRETWRYNVYRNDSLLGITTGPRWSDDVSRQYPASVPAQGRHTYRVAVANADTVGPKWESITMRVVSAFLYEDVKVDWEKRSVRPWPAGLFRIDTVGQELVAWRSAEYQGEVEMGGTGNAANVHSGWIEQWVSPDGGRNWAKIQDSLPLGAIPVRHKGRWWSVRRAPGDLWRLPPVRGYLPDVYGIRYSEVSVVSSVDGRIWDSVARLVVPENRDVIHFRYDRWNGRLVLIGSAPWTEGPSLAADQAAWFIDVGGASSIEINLNRTTNDDLPFVWGQAGGVWTTHWLDGPIRFFGSGWDHLYHLQRTEKGPGESFFPGVSLAGVGRVPSPYSLESDWKFVKVPRSKYLVFCGTGAFSFDSTMSQAHVIGWPGALENDYYCKGNSCLHDEISTREGILSVNDSGVFIGRVREPEPVDPRGTWVKKTEVPVRY